MGLEYQAEECGLGATESNRRSMCGKEETRSEWQKDECAQDIKVIKTKKQQSDGRRMSVVWTDWRVKISHIVAPIKRHCCSY